MNTIFPVALVTCKHNNKMQNMVYSEANQKVISSPESDILLRVTNQNYFGWVGKLSWLGKKKKSFFKR